MKRDPSIHVTESELALVLKSLLSIDNYTEKEVDILARGITTRLKTKSLLNRSLMITNDKLEKKASKLLSASRGDASLMANIIYNYRKKLKHRGVTQIKQNSRDWGSLKQLTKLTIEFCNDFNLGKREGFIEYTKLCFEAMNSTRGIIPKMVSLYERICNEYEAVRLINDDTNKNITKKIHDLYIAQIVKKTGMDHNYLKDPRKYSYFIKVREESERIGISIEIYMKAQFAGFEWRDGIPDPIQLIGDKAMERLNRYMYENSIKVGSTKNILTNNEIAERLRQLKKNIEDGNNND